MQDFGVVLNFVVCSYVFLHGLVYAYLLRHGCQKHSVDAPLDLCFRVWVWSWSIWVVIYLLQMLRDEFTPSWMYTAGLLILSDIHSVLLVLVYFGLTRGTNVTERDLREACAIAVLVVIVGDAALAVVEHFLAPKVGQMPILCKWSVSLGMFSPFLLGWGFRLRFRTNNVAIIGLVYALAQPVAYYVLIDNPFQRRLAIPTGVAVGRVVASSLPADDLEGAILFSNGPNGEFMVEFRRPVTRDMRKKFMEVVAVENRATVRAFLNALSARYWALTILAFLKLAWACAILYHFRHPPADMQSVLRDLGPPDANKEIVPRTETHMMVIVALALVGCALISRIVGYEVFFLALPIAAGTGFAIWRMRGGMTLLGLLRSIRGSADTDERG